MKNLNFDEFQLDTLTIYANPLTLVSGGYADTGDRDIRIEDWPCSLQSATSSQSPSPEKSVEFGSMTLVSNHIAIGSTVIEGILAGDWAEDGNGDVYEVMRFDTPGGTNPVGDVFLIILKKRPEEVGGGS